MNKNNVIWQKPTQDMPYEGEYFVAIKNHIGLGVYDLIQWNGKNWEFDYTGDVVGWVTLQDFMNTIKAGWPEWAATDLGNLSDLDSADEIVDISDD